MRHVGDKVALHARGAPLGQDGQPDQNQADDDDDRGQQNEHAAHALGALPLCLEFLGVLRNHLHPPAIERLAEWSFVEQSPAWPRVGAHQAHAGHQVARLVENGHAPVLARGTEFIVGPHLGDEVELEAGHDMVGIADGGPTQGVGQEGRTTVVEHVVVIGEAVAVELTPGQIAQLPQPHDLGLRRLAGLALLRVGLARARPGALDAQHVAEHDE